MDQQPPVQIGQSPEELEAYYQYQDMERRLQQANQ